MVADATTTSARHDTFSDVKIFIEREHPERQHAIEVVCSSARRDMDRHAKHVPYRFFCETLRLFPEFEKQQQQTDVNAGVATPQWPRTTTIACWHDCHPFDTTPVPIPKHTRGEGGNGGASTIFTVYGVFCSCNCAVAYILERNTYDQQNLLLRFRQMMLDVFNMNSDEVFAFEPAPPRIFLQLFGGHLHIDEFRRRSLVTRSTLLTHPFISYSMVLEENARQQQHQEGVVEGSVAGASSPLLSGASHYPALTHTARGLRRPSPVAAAVSVAAPETEALSSSLFSKFLTEKLASMPPIDDGSSAASGGVTTSDDHHATATAIATATTTATATDDATDQTNSTPMAPPPSTKNTKSKYIRKPSAASRNSSVKKSSHAAVAVTVATPAAPRPMTTTTTTTTTRSGGTLAAFLNKEKI